MAPQSRCGGGALRGTGETFSVNSLTGTGSVPASIPIVPRGSGFQPQSLGYDSGSGNGPFGIEWALEIPSVSRRTDRGVPRYEDSSMSDTFLLSGGDDLVPFAPGGAAGLVGDVSRHSAGYDGLVRSTDLRYRESPIDSFIESVTQSGYVIGIPTAAIDGGVPCRRVA
jgi:hypothetical protein